MQPMYYIGLDVHKRKISYRVKDGGRAGYTKPWASSPWQNRAFRSGEVYT